MAPPGHLTLCLSLLLALSLAGCQTAPAADASPALLDLHDRAVDPFAGESGAADGGARAIVFLFTRTDCPISNRYAPEVRRLHAKFAPRQVAFYLVYPDPDESPMTIRAHMIDYGYACDALRDPGHDLVDMTGATVTPEAAVFAPDGTMAYCGRIDDRFVDFGITRVAPSTRDLQDAIEAVLAGRPVLVARTTAIGCFIPDLSDTEP